MESTTHTPAIFSLGDRALTVDFGNQIDEVLHTRVIALMNELRQNPLPGIIEMVPAFSSLTLYYDCRAVRKFLVQDQTVFSWMEEAIEKRIDTGIALATPATRLVKVPVCYDAAMAPDMAALESASGLPAEEIIRLHTGKTYRVYMLGFLPGFAYMAPLDERISMPRKAKPRSIAAGSVGIAGLQTGIYPLPSPGGWQIIGRTPLILFNKDKEDPAFFQAGDRVEFYSISKEEFLAYEEQMNKE